MTLDDVAKGATPYALFDDNRTGSALRSRRPSYAPTTISGAKAPANGAEGERLLPVPREDLVPLGQMTFDPRTLNMHLCLRVMEILGCAEEMWQFVRQYQDKHLIDDDGQEATPRVHPQDPFHEDLVQLHRKDFDAMLTRYRLYVAYLSPCPLLLSVPAAAIWKTICTCQTP